MVRKHLALTIMGFLIIAMTIVNLMFLKTDTYVSIVRLIVLVCIALYGFWLYKIPHGNFLKYTLFIFLIINGFNILYLVSIGINIYFEAVRTVCLGAICYCSGRLHRIDQNKVIFVIVNIALFIINIALCFNIPEINALRAIWTFTMPISFLTITLGYFARYKEHKEAGLIDAPKA